MRQRPRPPAGALGAAWVLAVGLALPATRAPGEGKLQAAPAVAVAPDCARGQRRLQRNAACAFGKRVYLVAWCDGSRQVDKPTADIYCARVEAGTGKVLDPGGIAVCQADDLQESPAVAFDGKRFLVVWQDLRGGKDYDVYAARVSEAGDVLDAGGFPVVRRVANQARPAVAFAGGRYVVAWMDARQYPVYGLYAARVSTDGKVLDTEGRAVDAEDPQRVAKVTPPKRTWLGSDHTWWDRLSSRLQPTLASDGKTCLVTYLRDVHANRTTAHALRWDPGAGAVIGQPMKLPGEPRTRIAACSVPGGWVAAFDHWLAGWTPVPRLAVLRLEPSARARDEIPQRLQRGAKLPDTLLDVHEALAAGGGNHHQGKGHFSFWQATVAWNGRHVIVAMDYGWRTRRKVNELNYAIVAGRFDRREGRFVDTPPAVLATGRSGEGVSVCRPALAAGPAGETLCVYEIDRGLDRRIIEARLLRDR